MHEKGGTVPIHLKCHQISYTSVQILASNLEFWCTFWNHLAACLFATLMKKFHLPEAAWRTWDEVGSSCVFALCLQLTHCYWLLMQGLTGLQMMRQARGWADSKLLLRHAVASIYTYIHQSLENCTNLRWLTLWDFVINLAYALRPGLSVCSTCEENTQFYFQWRSNIAKTVDYACHCDLSAQGKLRK